MDGKRRFLEQVIASGLAVDTVATDDVVRHANATVLAENLPVELKSKLIAASLSAKAMDSKLVVDTLGTEALAEHLPMHVLWACIAECTERALGGAVAEAKGGADAAGQSKEPAKDSKAPKKARKSGSSVAKKEVKKVDGPPIKPVGVIPEVKPKPNAKAKPVKRRASLGRSPTTPIVPSDDFDIDTDVGDEDWGVDDIVEVVEDLVGAEPLDDTSLNEVSDWKTDEETVNRDADGKP